jgi:hypothetical protein
MKLSQIYRTALIAMMMPILLSGVNMRGFAQANSPQGARNIVLVHGAGADGSCWSRVIALLQAKGLHVVAVQNPLTSLADDVAAIPPKLEKDEAVTIKATSITLASNHLAMLSYPREVPAFILQAAAKAQ